MIQRKILSYRAPVSHVFLSRSWPWILTPNTTWGSGSSVRRNLTRFSPQKFALPHRTRQSLRPARPECSTTSPDGPKADRLMREIGLWKCTSFLLYNMYFNCPIFFNFRPIYRYTLCKIFKYTQIRRILIDKNIFGYAPRGCARLEFLSASNCVQLHWIHRLPGHRRKVELDIPEKKWWWTTSLFDSAQSTTLSWAFNVASYTWLAAPMGHFANRHEIFIGKREATQHAAAFLRKHPRMRVSFRDFFSPGYF